MTKTAFAVAAAAMALSWMPAARAAGLGGGDAPTLRCVIARCEGDCSRPYTLGKVRLDPRAGSDILFSIDDLWTVAPGRFTLEGQRYTGDSYLSRTTLDMAVDRATGALSLDVALAASGDASRKTTAQGTCRVVKTVPLFF